MEITKNIYIEDGELHINVTIEGQGATPDIYFTNMTIYNNKSFIDGNPIYLKTYSNNETSINEVLTESNLNAINQVRYDSCYPSNVNTGLFIIVFTLDYSPAYQLSHSCSEMPSILTFAVYNPCNLYAGLLPSINELEGDCNALPMNFINGILRKKAIDACINAGHFEQACKYWCKFYQHGAATYSSASTGGGCGCHG